MSKDRYLANAIEQANERAQYDYHVKRIIADKNVCAMILKHTVSEFNNCSIKFIKQCIQKDVVISKYPECYETEAITCLQNEEMENGSSKSFYDIRFSVVIPGKGMIKLFINIEAQKKYNQYLTERGIFYASRMISEQLGPEFDSDHYGDVKKVYSVWLCFDANKDVADTITKYHMSAQNLYGECKKLGNYDLINVIMVRLSKPEQISHHKLLCFLKILFSETIKPSEKKRILTSDYGLDVSDNFTEEVGKMCNLSQGILERGIEQGIKQGIQQGIEQGVEQATATAIENMNNIGVSIDKIYDCYGAEKVDKVLNKNSSKKKS